MAIGHRRLRGVDAGARGPLYRAADAAPGPGECARRLPAHLLRSRHHRDGRAAGVHSSPVHPFGPGGQRDEREAGSDHLGLPVRANVPAMKPVRIDFCDFWPGFRKDDNRIYNLLRTRFAVELSDRPDFATCDYALTCHYVDDPRHLRWPLYSFYYDADLLLRENGDVDGIMAAKTHFCAFVASNTRRPRTTRKRNAFFHRLSRYKQVDAGGRAFNNIGYQVPGGPLGKIEFLKRYKFNIAFENASLPGYTTEKIVEPMAARCLPIYWGNPLVEREFNPKSFLNYCDFRDEDALIENVVELDRNDALYRQYLAEPYFHHNKPNEFFGFDRVLDHFEMIFSASTRPVARRRRLLSLGRWTLARRDPT